MPRPALCLSLLLPLVFVVPARAAADRGWLLQRERARQARIKLREQAASDRQRRAERAVEIVTDLVATAEAKPVPGCVEQLRQLLVGLRSLDEATAKQLGERVEGLRIPDSEGAPPDPADVNDWNSRLRSARKKLVARPGELLNRSVKLGVVDLSYGFLREVLDFNPDEPSIRRSLRPPWCTTSLRRPWSIHPRRWPRRWRPW